MDQLPYGTPPRWWPPRLRPLLMAILRRPRVRRVRRREHLVEVEPRGLETLRRLIEQNHGVLITSKHVGHVDPYIFLAAGDRLGVPFYYMVGWQVFELLRPLERWVLQRHGAFSIDREGNDLRAFRLAVEILQTSRHPLVMFPEGEIYHHSEWVVPFRAGTAAIALAAARRGKRPISCVPAAIKYEYVQDPMPRLLQVADALEHRLAWRPRRELPLYERLRRVAEGWVTLLEMEYLGEARRGELPQRIATLAEAVVRSVEKRQGAEPAGANIPERSTPLRQQAIRRREALAAGAAGRVEAERDLDDVNVAVQLFSYSHDFDREPATLERLAEMVDKLEEDVLGAPTATIKGDRRAVIAFGKPVEIQPGKKRKDEAAALTEALEAGVRETLREVYGRDLAVPDPRG